MPVRPTEIDALGKPKLPRGCFRFSGALLGSAETAEFAASQIDDGGGSAAAHGIEQQAAAAKLRIVGVGCEDDQIAGRGVGGKHSLGFFQLRGQLAPLVFTSFDLLAAMLHRFERFGLLREVVGEVLEHTLQG